MAEEQEAILDQSPEAVASDVHGGANIVVGSETVYGHDGQVMMVNDTEVSDDAVFAAIDKQVPALASAFNSWGASNRQGGLFSRDRYVTPSNIFEQFRTARDAASSDDVVAGVVEGTENMAFNGVRIDCEDPAQEDIWNQVIEDIDLETRIREMWRESFTLSQFYAAIAWKDKKYKAEGNTKKGNSMRTEKRLKVPAGISLFDPLTVLPVGNFLFNQEKLVFLASPSESDDWDNMLAMENTTQQEKYFVDSQIVKGRYEPSESDRVLLGELFGDAKMRQSVENLWELNPKTTFRHTATRPSYQRFADVRMKSVFELLDLKHQLREMDRAHLLGGTNFIVLVRKGSDTMPAKAGELTNLTQIVRNAARVPIIVGDHRLQIEIITPKLDLTLQPERYNGLDARITARLYQIFMTGNFAAGAKGDDSIKLARVIARGMEARRRSIGQAVIRHVIKPIKEANSEFFTDKATLQFSPRKVALDFDAAMAQYIENARLRGDLSRESALDLVDYDEHEEAAKRKNSKELGYDKVFTPPAVPFSGTQGAQQGGNNNGAGQNPDSNMPNRTPRGGNKQEGAPDKSKPESKPRKRG